MKKHFVLILALSFLANFTSLITLLAQSDNPLQWHTFWGDTTYADEGQAIVASGGFIYITGTTRGTWKVDSNIVKRKYLPVTHHYPHSGFVAKFESDGSLIWVTYLGGHFDEDGCWDLAVTDQAIYVCGSSAKWDDPTAVNPVPNTIHQHYVHGGRDAFVTKLTLDGEISWLTFLGGQQQDFATGMALDEVSGMLYITGHSSYSWTSDSYQGAAVNAHAGLWRYDVFAAKLDTNGNYYWHTFMGSSSGDDYGSAIDFDASGNVYVGASMLGPLPGFTALAGHAYRGNYDGFIAKLDNTGELGWHMFMGEVGSSAFSDNCRSLRVGGDSSLYVTGSSWGEWGPSWPSPKIPYDEILLGNNNDIYVAKVSVSGTPIWYTFLGEEGGDNGEDLILTADGDLYVTGKSSKSWGDPALPKPSNGGADIFAARLDSDGNLEWNIFVGSWADDWGYGIDIDASGEVYTTGFSRCSWCTASLNPHSYCGYQSPYNQNTRDIFIAKLDPNEFVIQFDTVVIEVIEGQIAQMEITVNYPCGTIEPLSASWGTLMDNGNGSWTWNRNTLSDTVGDYHVTIFGNDGSGWTPHNFFTLVIKPSNMPPEVTVTEEIIVVLEGQVATNSGTVEDPDEDEITLSSSVGTVVGTAEGEWDWNFKTVDGPAESQVVYIHVDDGNGGEAIDSFDLLVQNVPPVFSSVVVPLEPISFDDQTISITGLFTDSAALADQPFVCSVDFGDGTGLFPCVVDNNSFSSPYHLYSSSGVYTIVITLTDKDGDSSILEVAEYVVVYDPSEGFVTGGGWIHSPSGAFMSDTDLTGKANFGFVSKYKKGQSTPFGNTEFQFKAADLNFRSTSYDWLVIAGAKAMFKGEGTINGEGNYGFQLSAIDEDLTPSTDVDLFRIRIWDRGNHDGLVYDNKVDENDPNADPTTGIGGGNIKIHKGNNKNAIVIGSTGSLDRLSFSNYPNPFEIKTTIRYQLLEAARVSLRIFDMSGVEIITLVEQYQSQGDYSYEFDASDRTSGIYFCQLTTDHATKILKMVVNK